jgi:hypothetical protein
VKKLSALTAVVVAVLALMSGVAQWLLAHPVVAAVLGVIGWLVFVHNSPYRTCRWCRKRRDGKRWPCRRRCWRCRNTRETRRLGAYRIHKVKDSLIQAWNERE